MAGPLRTAKDGAPQTCSPLDGARYRHHNLRCPYLLASDLRDWEEPRNTAALRQRTVRCEHPDCWGSYRRDAEGGSPFGCLECGTTDFTSGVHRDRCGRFRICTRCYTGLSGDLTGTSTEIRDLVFSRFEWWDTARPNPKAFRRDRPDRCPVPETWSRARSPPRQRPAPRPTREPRMALRCVPPRPAARHDAIPNPEPPALRVPGLARRRSGPAHLSARSCGATPF
jgi:hypothetical protein